MRGSDSALDRLIRESDHLRGRWALDLFDARGELDLRSALETPRLHRPFRTPGYPVTPAVFLLVTGLLTVATAREHPRVSVYAVVSILAGVPFYYVWQSKIRFLDVLRQTPKLIWRGPTKERVSSTGPISLLSFMLRRGLNPLR